MKRVAVTGGSGFMGRAFVARLAADPEVESIVILDIAASRPAPKVVHLDHDVSRPFGAIFREHRIDAAAHLAFIVNPIYDRKRMREVNVGGTQNFFAACDEAGVRDVLVTSSTTAYGARPGNPERIPEDHPIPETLPLHYAADKCVLERLCASWASAHPECALAVARPCIVLAPDVDNFISRYLLGKRMYGVKGHNPDFQFVHNDDAAEILYRLLKERRRGAYNVVADGTVPFRDIRRHGGAKVRTMPGWLLRFLGRLAWALRLTSLSECDAGIIDNFQYRWVSDNSKVKRDLGFTFRHTSVDALASAVRDRPQGS